MKVVAHLSSENAERAYKLGQRTGALGSGKSRGVMECDARYYNTLNAGTPDEIKAALDELEAEIVTAERR